MRLIAPTTLWLLVWGCTPDPGESEPPEGDDTAATEDSEPTGEAGETGETGDTDDDTQQPEDTAVEVLTVDVQRGDLVLWGRPAVEPGDEGYDLQAQIMFCEYAAEFAHRLRLRHHAS